MIKRMILGLVALAATLGAQANSYLSLAPATLSAGMKQTLSINLTNDEDITAFQFDVKLPSGITVNTMVNDDDEQVHNIQLTERKKSSHQLTCSLQDDGSYRVVLISMSNQSLRNNDGAVVDVSVMASSVLASGDYNVELRNIHLVPLVGGKPGERIDQPDVVGSIYVNNASESSDVEARLSVSTTELTAGQNNQTLELNLQNNIDITAFQFDIALPAGITVNTMLNDDDEQVPAIELSGRKKSSHLLTSNRLDDGSYRVALLSMSNQALSGNNGTVVTLRLNVPITLSGTADVVLRNIHLVPLVNGRPGIRIDQADLAQSVTISNNGGGERPSGPMALTVASLTLKPGDTGLLNIDLTNDRDVCSFQFNLNLPAGVSVVKEYNADDEYVEAISLSARKKSSHLLSFKQTDDGGYFFLAYSLSNATFRDNSGSIVSIKVKADENMAEGTYGVVLRNAIIITPDEQKFEQADYSGTLTIGDHSGIATAAAGRVVRSQWFDLQGRPASAATPGIVVRRDVLSDGSVRNVKITNNFNQ